MKQISDYFQITVSNANIIFAFFLCYFPMLGVVKFPVRKIWTLGCTVLSVYTLLVSFAMLKTGIPSNYLLFPFLPVFFLAYWKTLNTNIYKALTIFLLVISVFCFETLYTDIFAARMHLGMFYTDYAWGSAIFSTCLCACILACLYIPATIHIRWLVEHYDDFSLWRNGLVWPVIFIGVSLFIIPRNYNSLSETRYFCIYLVIVSLLLFCMFYMYALLYQMAKKQSEINALERHNHFLGFQSKQYHALTDYIAATRKIRHDFRHQIATLQTLADNGDLDSLRNYLSQYQESTQSGYRSLCANPAVNAIASHYHDRCAEQQISISWVLDLPRELPLPEPEYCVMLGNLVENAMDASKTLPEDDRKISVISQMPTNSILILIVENNHNSIIRRNKQGLISSKHASEAIGLVSVRETVEHYHGDLRIDYDKSHFSVSILLNL
ncbi:MAG: GHKL domain-containing protein [Lachnospiraceae bacterium]|nr:GHKL domain-containing protein [Lachnospiraceae bacterium]